MHRSTWRDSQDSHFKHLEQRGKKPKPTLKSSRTQLQARLEQEKVRQQRHCEFVFTEAYTDVLTVQCFGVTWTTLTSLSLLVFLQPFLLLIVNLGWDDGTLFKNSTLTNLLETAGAKPELALPSWHAPPDSWVKGLASFKSRWGGFRRHCCLYSFTCCFFQTLCYCKAQLEKVFSMNSFEFKFYWKLLVKIKENLVNQFPMFDLNYFILC